MLKYALKFISNKKACRSGLIFVFSFLILNSSFLIGGGIVSAAVASSATSTLSTSSLSQGLVGYWTMDGKDINWGTNTMIDRSGLGNTATLRGLTKATSTVPGKIGQAINFATTSNFRQSIKTGILNTDYGQQATISVWVKFNQAQSLANFRGVIVGSNYWTDNDFILEQHDFSNGSIFFTVGSGKYINFTIPSVKVGVWYHIAVVFDSTQPVCNNKAKAYVNDVLVTNASCTITTEHLQVGGVSNMQIGGIDGVIKDLFNGSIDDVRVYNRALSPTEIFQLYNQGAGSKIAASATTTPSTSSISGINSGLVGYWTMDGKDINWTTNKIIDRSNFGNTGTLYGLAKATSTVAGKIGQALQFASSSQTCIVNVGSNYPSIANAGSLSAWFKKNTPNSIGDVAAYVDKAGNRFQLGTYTNSLFGGTFYNGTSYGIDGTVNDTKWHHAISVWNGVSAQLYIDGVAQSDPHGPAANNTWNVFVVGCFYSPNKTFFDGLIDDVRIYNRALSAAEVAQLYNQTAGSKIAASATTTPGTSSISGINSGLVGYWTMDGKDINWTTNTIVDRSGNGNNGTLYALTKAISTTPGKIGQALVFASSTSNASYILANDSPSLESPSTALSISAWIYQTNSSQQTILTKPRTTNTDRSYSLYSANSKFWLELNTGPTGAAYPKCQQNNSYSLNKWVHVVATWNNRNGDATDFALYVNGNQTPCTYTANGYGVGQTIKYSNLSLAIGAANSYNPMKNFEQGPLDDVRVYNRALSPTEVLQLYNMGR